MSVSWFRSNSWFRSKPRWSGGSARKPPAGHHRISRLVREGILADVDFRNDLSRIADAQGESMEQASRRAEHYLKEIAASPSRFMTSLAAALGRLLYRRAYEEIHYDRERLGEVFRLGAEHPIVFLPCHRSNLDRPVMHYLLWKNNHAPNYTAGGINMNFFPIGPISRRAGVFFIRRTFTDNPVYKLVLQTYFSYLIEQRLPLEWYIEGGRSRTGKLRSPRYGLLGYAADALTAGKSDDVYLIPTSINYDHVLEIDAYAAEQSGIAKEKETFGWLVKSIRSLRKRYGDIHVRFGEPLSMRSMIDPDRIGRERRRDLQGLASEVCMRINRVTPVTPMSLVVVALLSDRDRALSRHRLEAVVGELVDHVESRDLPSSEPLSVLRSDRCMDSVLGGLVNLGTVEVESGESEPSGSDPGYRIIPGRRLAAAYYSNTIVHFFLPAAIAEVGLMAAAGNGTSNRPSKTFHDHVASVIDLLSFEFFFPDLDVFIDEITTELDRRDPGWKDSLENGYAAAVIERLRPHRAPWVLRPIVEAYLVVAEELVDRPPEQPWERPSFLQAALERSTRYVATGRISAEAASLSLFANTVRAAARRNLLGPGSDDLTSRRATFATELKMTLAVVDSLYCRPRAAGDAVSDHPPRIQS